MILLLSFAFDSEAFVSNQNFSDPREPLASLHFSPLRLLCMKQKNTTKLAIDRLASLSFHHDKVMYASKKMVPMKQFMILKSYKKHVVMYK